METSTSILGMVQGNSIIVPDYQRAYSWETGNDNDIKKQVNVFLADLEDYLRSKVRTPYYFGHFLYEDLGDFKFAIIDGQQRLTTINIFLCAAFKKIEADRELTDKEAIAYEDVIKRRGNYKFSTVQYDNQLFRDYVIDGTKKDHYNIETSSGKRIVAAYDFFTSKLSSMSVDYVCELLSCVLDASCTTHIVNGESEAIQMFIFQNNRGKKPSQLEVIKAQFMYNAHIYGKEETESIIYEIKNRFEHIYHRISDIEDFVDEDDVLRHTLKVHFNSLWEGNALERINGELLKDSRIDFIRQFSKALEVSFNNIARLKADALNDTNIEGALLCKRYDIVLPFFIKAYMNGLNQSEISKLGKVLGDLMLRDAIIRTKADLRSRLNDVYCSFTDSIHAIVERINYMKTTDNWWWGYWNNGNLSYAINGNWDPNTHNIAKIILWKYENYLIQMEGKSGYAPIRFNSVKNSQLEHISPQTENESIAAGYDTYDEEFMSKYLLCLGNFLLLSASHNESIGNRPFEQKRESYNQLRQQREIQLMTEEDKVWNREKIQARKEKLTKFILENL